MRELGASYSFQVDQDANTVRINMGFHTFSIFIKNSVAEVPKMEESCVLPYGPSFLLPSRKTTGPLGFQIIINGVDIIIFKFGG